MKYPCLYDKINKDYHDRNKRDIAKHQIAEALNAAFGYFDTEGEEEPNPHSITGNISQAEFFHSYFLGIMLLAASYLL